MKIYFKNTDGELKKIKTIIVNGKIYTPDEICKIQENGTVITMKDGKVYRITDYYSGR